MSSDEPGNSLAEASLENFLSDAGPLETSREVSATCVGVDVSVDVNAKAPVVYTGALKKIHYTHDAMIDMILSEPSISQDQLAVRFGYSASWISQVICSDAFQAKLAQRRNELVDPVLAQSIDTQFKGLVSRSMEILREKLSKPAATVPDQLVLQALKIASQAAGYGARVIQPPSAPPVSMHVHLESLGENLVGLLRRKRSEVIDSEVFHDQQDDTSPAQP
jgi:hypothetical protein